MKKIMGLTEGDLEKYSDSKWNDIEYLRDYLQATKRIIFSKMILVD